jgi:hypothetical protein
MRRAVILLLALVLTISVVAPVAAVRQQTGGGTTFVALLTGQNEVNGQGVRGQGDPDGFGIAIVNVNAELERVCWLISVARIDTVTMSHIHRGPKDVNGPVVVNLMPPLANPTAFGCNDGDQVTTELANEIIANPAGFYVNVHTELFGPGAIRGQLKRLFGPSPMPV